MSSLLPEPNVHEHVYRPDIDGLRAIAVLSVLLFHLSIWPFTGGFVGVDIFFVISGYLITQIIYRELREDRFSLSKFYVRRIRRIFPALYVTIALTIIVSLLIYEPFELSPVFGALSRLAIFLSNGYFMRHGGYFDGPLEENPLLQTWSLSVEEQYYLVFPLILMLVYAYARKYLRIVIVALAVISLAVGAIRVPLEPEKAFFATDVRVVELMIGAIVALGLLPQATGNRLRIVAAVVGLALMIGSVFLLSAEIPFPGLAAMPVCLGTALLIWSGERHEGTAVHRLLATTPLVTIGLISYSLYLLHWPMIVFAKRLKLDDLSNTDKASIAALAIILAYLSWRFVETPFRRPSGATGARPVFATAIGLIATLGLGSLAVSHFKLTPAPEVLAKARAARKHAASDPCLLGVKSPPGAWKPAKCVTGVGDRLVAIWGDSYAGHYFDALRDWSKASNVRFAAFAEAACPPAYGLYLKKRPPCKKFNDMVMQRLEELKPDVVLLSAYWLNYEKRRSLLGNDVLDQLRETVRRLRSITGHVVLIGPSPIFPGDVPLIALAKTGPAASGHYTARNSKVFDEFFRELAKSDGVEYVPTYELYCQSGNSCKFSGTNDSYFWDKGHMTREGADIVIGHVTPLIEGMLKN